MKKIILFVSIIISILLPLLMSLIFGGVFSGVWLLIIGHGKYVGIGLVIAILMPMVYTILTLPTFWLIPVVSKMVESENIFGFIIGIIVSIYEKMLLYLWLVYAFDIFFISNNLTGVAIVPLVLWGFTVVNAPLSYMAKKGGNGQGIATVSGSIATFAGYILLIILWYLKFSAIFLYGIPFMIYVFAIVIQVLYLNKTINIHEK